MKKAELAKMTIRELRELGGKLSVPIGKDMKKADMVNTLSSKPDTPEAGTGSAESGREYIEARPAHGPGDGWMEQTVEESKFYTGPATHEAIWGLPVELPQHYNDDKITLLVRDPYWAYAYWEVTPKKMDMARAELGEGGSEASLTLRVYDVTNVIFDGGNANSYYDIGVYERISSWYMDVGKPGNSFICDLGLKTRDGRFITLARSNAISVPRDGVSEVLDEEWVMADRDFERIYALSGLHTGAVGLSSAELRMSAGGRMPFGIASPGMGSLALMSPSLKRQRGFWYMLNTELIVYGATEPDAKVTVQGKAINLRPDGTFSLRFALPDGDQLIPVSFTSADEVDTGWITPEVKRDTNYS